MKFKNKKMLYSLLLIGFALLSYIIWMSVRPVEIVAVHVDGSHSSVLVKNFPYSDKGKINWWIKNKEIIKEKYNIPNPEKDGDFTIIFWLFGDGYKQEEKYDRRCFGDMKPPENCIDKNRIFSVDKSRNMGISFTTDSEIYQLKGNGEVVKVKLE
ncbi:DUF943 family protein [Erwinia psidii]|uniref:DUF943 family protein n=1 Tax=Erwinia psidii TaxID=69224 RepID=UPI00226B9660|nr:DUF943 family protein [Erwinia psidii]MCX8967458.1 DUF943 family protein [Erwinia psidii]